MKSKYFWIFTIVIMLSFVTQFFNYSYSQSTSSPSPSGATSPASSTTSQQNQITYPNCNGSLTVVELRDKAIFCVQGEDRANEIEKSLKEISKDPFDFDDFILHPSSNALQEGLRISHNIKLKEDDYIAVKNGNQIEWRQLKSFKNQGHNTGIIDKNITVLHSNSIIEPHNFNIASFISNPDIPNLVFYGFFFLGLVLLILAALVKGNIDNIYESDEQDENVLTLPILLTIPTFFGMLFILIAFSKLFLDDLTTYFVFSITIVFGVTERTWTSLNSAKLAEELRKQNAQLAREKRAIEHIAYWDSSVFQEIRQAFTELDVVNRIKNIQSGDKILEYQANEIKEIIEHQDTEQRRENEELLKFINVLDKAINEKDKDEYRQILDNAKDVVETRKKEAETERKKQNNFDPNDSYFLNISEILNLINGAIKYNENQNTNKDCLLKIKRLIQDNKKYPLDVYFRTLCNFWEQTYWLLTQNIADESMIKNSFCDLYTNEYYAVCRAFLRSKDYIDSSDENPINQNNSLIKLMTIFKIPVTGDS
ncbi:MAG: hypothetical protein AB4372_22230 [Xenococcus sp. (in: cyanobacteria)]